jgi:hypothetical protein
LTLGWWFVDWNLQTYLSFSILKMDSNIDLILLNESNYTVWEPYMETLLKRKGLWKYMNIVIPNQMDDQEKYIIDGKKDEVVGVITTHILWEIHFHLSGINHPYEV